MPVENGFGESRLSDALEPEVDGVKTGDESGAVLPPILEDFEEVMALVQGEWQQTQVVQDQ